MDTIVMSKKDNENPVSLYRRFVKHFRLSGIQPFTKKNRFHARKFSKTVRKKNCITRLDKREKFESDYRMGKVQLQTWKKKK